MKVPLRLSAALLLVSALAGAQTKITAPNNSYTPAQDVELGREAAAEVTQATAHPARRQRQLVHRGHRPPTGRRRFPADLQASRVPIHLRAGERARDQRVRAARRADVRQPRDDRSGEHRRRSRRRDGARAEPRRSCATAPRRPARRRSTRSARSPAPMLGAIIGGGWGQVISQGSQFGLGTAFLRFSREYEKQADILGSQIMARAGYDPRDMANMFKTIEKEGGSGGPQWLSDHPNPGNRVDYITKEAADAARREPDPRHARRSRRCRRISSRCRRRRRRSRRRSNTGNRPTGTSGEGARADRTRAGAGVELTGPTPKATCSRSACRPTGVRSSGRTP